LTLSGQLNRHALDLTDEMLLYSTRWREVLQSADGYDLRRSRRMS
jgi:hypothetical protein